MAKHKGKDIILKIDGTAVAASTGCTLQVDQSFLEVCAPTDGRAQRFIPSTYGWTASFEALCANMVAANDIIDCVTAGTQLDVEVNDNGENNMARSGKAYVKSATITGNVGSLVRLQVSLQGSGALGEAD